MANYKIFNPQEDIVSGKQKLKVFPIWSDSPSDADTNPESTLRLFYTSSVELAERESYYYYNIYGEDTSSNANAPVQFSLSFGSSQSIQLAHPDDEYRYTYPSRAVYGQHISQIIQNSTSFRSFARDISSSSSAPYYMKAVYFIDISRARLKDGIELSTWQLNLSGSGGSNGNLLTLINPTTAEEGDEVVDIVTGDLSDYTGKLSIAPEGQPMGVLYPERGLFVLDAAKIHDYINTASAANITAWTGSGPGEYTASVYLNDLYSLVSSGSYFRARTREMVQTTNYFCRAKNYEFNYSTNPTWVTGSTNEIIDEFYEDPKTFITTVGLYDGEGESGQLVAVAKLSRPVPKSSDTEALIKVQLSF